MAREFVMGARINMSDGFSSPVSRMTQTTRQFGDAARSGGHAVDGMGRSAMASTAGLGAFTAGSRAANLSARGLAGGVATLTASMLGLNSIMGAVMGLLTFKFAYDWLIKSNSEMEQYQNTLTVVLKSSERAKETLEWATKFAADTPFEIPQVVEATTKLETYGLTAQKTLGNIGDMASVMGKPLMQAVEAVADAQTGEVERLKEFGITKDMLAAQSEKMGTTAIDKKGSITDQVAFNAALFTLMEDRYKGGMEMQSKSFKGMLSNVADFIGTMGREFGKPIFERMRVGLAGALGFLDTIKENGTMEAITAKAQAFGLAVTDVFGAAFGLIGRVVTQLSTKIGVFLDNNAPRFALIGNTLGNAFATLQTYAMPVLNWLIDTALSKLIDVLLQVHTWQLQIVEFFITNWSNIEPFVMGIAVAFGLVATAIGLVAGPLAILAGIGYTIIQVTKAWAAAQAFLNMVMAVNPIYLMILGIGLLIGAGIWLVQNWAMVGQFFSTLWTNILAGFTAGFTWIGQGVSNTLTEVATLFANLIPQALDWGATLIRTFVSGILSMKNYLVDSISSVFSAARQLMPFSDAKEGPFSQLTYSGGAIMSTMAEGVTANADMLHGAMGDAFNAAPRMTTNGDNLAAANAGLTDNASMPYWAMGDAFNAAPSIATNGENLTAASAGGNLPISTSAATPRVSGSSTTIGTLIGSLTINGADKDAGQLANEIIEILHDRLSGANDIMGADMATLL